MKRIVLSLLLLATVAGPALAQGHKTPPAEDNPLAQKEEVRRRENAAIDKQYQKTLQQTQGVSAPAKNDPWANMRGTDAPKR